MNWIKTSEQVPEIGERVLILLNRFEYDDEPEYKFCQAQRIEKEHVPLFLLERKQEDDKNMRWDLNKEEGWVPGVCFEWVECEHLGPVYCQESMRDLQNSIFKFIAGEVKYWSKLPEFPKD